MGFVGGSGGRTLVGVTGGLGAVSAHPETDAIETKEKAARQSRVVRIAHVYKLTRGLTMPLRRMVEVWDVER
jgi:hypothetical protein